MKKLMFAAAALAAGVVVADVQSANIVGYVNNETSQEGGAKMLAAPFLNIGASEAGFWLSDITPQGYLDNESLWENYGCDGHFSIQTLKIDGTTDKIFGWKHDCDDEGNWENNAHWNDSKNVPVVPHQVGSDLFVKVGSGLWTVAPEKDGDEEATYDVNTAGEVTMNSVKWTLSIEQGAVALANPYPVSLHISDLIPQGYLDNEDLWENYGCDGHFSLQTLKTDGTTDLIYGWKHDCDDEGNWEANAHWNDPKNVPVVPGGENDLEIKCGEGVWMVSPDASEAELEVGTPDYFVNVNYPKAN